MHPLNSLCFIALLYNIIKVDLFSFKRGFGISPTSNGAPQSFDLALRFCRLVPACTACYSCVGPNPFTSNEIFGINTTLASSAFVHTNAIFASRFSYGSANYLLGTAQTLTILHPGMQVIEIEWNEGTVLMDFSRYCLSITKLRKTGTGSSGLFIFCLQKPAQIGTTSSLKCKLFSCTLLSQQGQHPRRGRSPKLEGGP